MSWDAMERLAEEVGWRRRGEWVEEGPVSANVVRRRLGLPPISGYEYLRPVGPERTGCAGLLLIALGFGGAAYAYLARRIS